MGAEVKRALRNLRLRLVGLLGPVHYCRSGHPHASEDRAERCNLTRYLGI